MSIASTIVSWGVTYLMHSTLLIGGVWMATSRIASAAVRDALWKVALVGGLVTATLQVALPVGSASEVRVWNAEAPAAIAPAVDDPALAAVRTNVDSLAPAAVVSSTPSSYDWRMPAAETWLIGWSAIALLLLARLLRARERLVRLLASRQELVLGEERELVDDLAQRAGCRRVVRLTRSDAIASPIAMLRWEIVIPGATFARLNDEQRRTILAHELAHLQRRDPLWLTIAECCKALFFFQPLNVLAAAKMKETAEYLCDDAAIVQTGDRQALAETLAELASTLSPMPARVAAMAEGGSNLVARVRRVLRAHTTPDLPLPIRWRIALAGVPIAIVAVLAPGVAPAKMAAQIGSVSAPLEKRQAPEDYYFADTELERRYEGRDGATTLTIAARGVRVSADGRPKSFDDARAFVRARYVADVGPERQVLVTPGPRLEPIYRYTIDGQPHEWCSDAARMLEAAATGRNLEDVFFASDDGSSAIGEWTATIRETGDRDAVPLTIRIDIDLRFDRLTGAIDLDRTRLVDVEERFGDRERRFSIVDGRARLDGDFDGTTRAERRAWIVTLLRRHAAGNDRVIRNLAALAP